MMEIIEAIALALIAELAVELIKNLQFSADPFSLRTQVWALTILIDTTGLHLELWDLRIA